jgi:hypothetical protein
VVIDTPERTSVLNRPVRGTKLIGNWAWIRGNKHPYRWVEGHAESAVALNRSLGRPVGIPAGAPPTPAPDLTVPTVGALPPC